MQPSDFVETISGRVIRSPLNYWAFVPRRLPPPLEISWGLAATISEADRAIAELAGIARNLPNPFLLIGPFMRREAVLSSRIEGTQASLSDLFFFEASGGAEQKTPDVREVANYVKALEYGLDRQSELPLSLRLIREIHAKLMHGVRGEHLTPGEFRRSQNWIGPLNCTLMEATFVPPPPVEMNESLAQLELYLHEPSTYPALVRMAFIHYQFEAIHPFLDGNGRIGRLLVTLLLCKEGLLPKPLLYLSAYFERNRTDYYSRLLEVSRRGAWEDWLEFFLTGIREQAIDAMQRSDRLLALWRTYRERTQAARASALLLRMIDYLFMNPAVSVPIAARLLGVTVPSAQKSIGRLVNDGILREATGRKRNRVFVADEIIAAIEDDHPPYRS